MPLELDMNEEELLRMESYFRGELPPEEQTVFENELMMNPSLKQKYDQWRLLFVGIGEASLQEKLAGFHQAIKAEDEQPAKAKEVRMGSWLMAAAAVLVLAIGGWLLFFNTTAAEKTFAAFYKPDPGLPTVMGGTDKYAFDKAMVEYKSGNYKAAINGWQALLTTAAVNDTLNYFLGSALLADGQAEKALPYLKFVADKAINNSSADGLQADAAWYTGLAIIRLKRYAEAKPFIHASNREEKQAVLKDIE